MYEAESNLITSRKCLPTQVMLGKEEYGYETINKNNIYSYLVGCISKIPHRWEDLNKEIKYNITCIYIQSTIKINI